MVLFSCSTKTDREILEKIDREEGEIVRSELHMSLNELYATTKALILRLDEVETTNKVLVQDNHILKQTLAMKSDALRATTDAHNKLFERFVDLETKLELTSAVAKGADAKAEQVMNLHVKLQGEVGDIIRANKGVDAALGQILEQCDKTDKQTQNVEVCLDRLVKSSTEGRMDTMCDDLENKITKLTDLVPTVKERVERIKDALGTSFKAHMSRVHTDLLTELKGCMQDTETRLNSSMGTYAIQARNDTGMLWRRVNAITDGIAIGIADGIASGEGSSKGKKRSRSSRMNLSSSDEDYSGDNNK